MTSVVSKVTMDDQHFGLGSVAMLLEHLRTEFPLDSERKMGRDWAMQNWALT